MKPAFFVVFKASKKPLPYTLVLRKQGLSMLLRTTPTGARGELPFQIKPKTDRQASLAENP
jgi:hypothetical protein